MVLNGEREAQDVETKLTPSSSLLESFARSPRLSPTRRFELYPSLKPASSRLSERSSETKTGELALGQFKFVRI